MSFPCDLEITCLPCPTGNPLRNTSAEEPDPVDFFAVSFYAGNPPLNAPPEDYTTPNGYGICFGATQQAASDCALAVAQENAWNPWRTPGGGSVPRYGNSAQSCTVPCSDGENFSYTVAANTFYAHSQAEADAIAASYCMNRAIEARVCPPLAVTLDATDVADTTASLNGTINPNNTDELDVTVGYFEWGTTNAYGHITPLEIIGTGTTAVAITAPITGLTSGDYHFRVVAINALGMVFGADKTFTIAATCSNPDVPVPTTIFVAVSEPALVSGVFQTTWVNPAPANNILSATIPVGGTGVYQVRYVQDGQGYNCSGSPADFCVYGVGFGHYLWLVNGADRTATDIYSDWQNGNNPFGIGMVPHAGFDSATAGYHIGVSDGATFDGFWNCGSTPPPDYDPDPGAVYDDSYITAALTNPAFPARYQSFCLERNLYEGDVVSFGLYQELYQSCGGRASMIRLGNGPTWEILRVGTLLPMPLNLRVVNFAAAMKELLCPAANNAAGVVWTGNISRTSYQGKTANAVDSVIYSLTDGSNTLLAGDPAVGKSLVANTGVRVYWTAAAWICEIRCNAGILVWSGRKTKGATPVGKYEITGGCTSLACLEWEEF